MECYAGEKDIQVMDEMVRLAQRLIEYAEAAKESAHTVVDNGPLRGAIQEFRDEAQGRYDSQLLWVRKLAEDLHTAATKLP